MTNQKPIAAGLIWSIPATFVATAGGFLAAYVDSLVTHPHDNVSIEAILLVLLSGILAGTLCPRLAWASALLAGFGLPFGHVAVWAVAYWVPRPVPFRKSDFLALLLSFIGAAAGAGWRVFLARPLTSDNE
jgi:hypothetical protein